MKFFFKIIIFSIIFIFILESCSENEPESIFEQTFLIVTYKKVEKFENNKSIGKEITKYFYDRQNDFFWFKAITKDSSGNIIRTIYRKLDTKSRMPTEEIIKENGIIVKKIKLIYSIDNYEPLFKEEYIGKRKIRTRHWKYNENGYLISIIDTLYDKNVNRNDINRIKKIEMKTYLTSISKPKGLYAINGFTKLKEVYNNKQIDTFMITKFDSLNYPLYDSLYDGGNSNINWYKIVVDNSQIVGIISYDDKDLLKLSNKDKQLTLDYNSNGYIESIKQVNYNEMSGEFDKFNGSKIYEWILPKFKSRYNYADFNMIELSYCNSKKEHTKYEKKIVRFDEVGEKVVEEYFGTTTGDCNEDTEIETELVKRTTYVFNKLEITGERAVIYKNKKVEKEVKKWGF